MSEKLFLLLMVIFFLFGIYAYDVYITEKGGISPISKILDMAGLSKFDEFRKTKTTLTEESYKFSAEQNLARLRMRYREIEGQRQKLIDDRTAIIEQLLSINNRLQEEAETFARVIQKDKDDFLARFPEIERLGKAIINAYRNGKDSPEPTDEYKNTKNELIALLAEMSGSSDESLHEMVFMFDEIEGALYGGNALVAVDCEGPEQCLSETLGNIDLEMKRLMRENISKPSRDIAKILELTELLNREYDALLRNSQATDSQLNKKFLDIESELKSLVSQLIKVQDTDIKKLVKMYEKFSSEQEMLLDNLEMNRERIMQVYDMTMPEIKKKIDALVQGTKEDVDELLSVYRDEEFQQVDLMNEFQLNAALIVDLYDAQSIESEKFLTKITGTVVATKEIMQRRQAAEQRRKAFLQDRLNTVQNANAQSRPPRARMNRNGSNPYFAGERQIKAEQKRRQQEVRQKMQDARHQAYDQGFNKPHHSSPSTLQVNH